MRGGCGPGADGRFGACGLRLGGDNWRPRPSDADWLRSRDSRERAGLGEGGRNWFLNRWGGGVVGNFVDHFVFVEIEMDARRIFHGDVKSAKDELGAAEVDGIANQGVYDFHERGLDAFFVFEEGDGVKARLGGSAHAANHALMKVAEDFAVQGGRAAGDSVDLNVSADADILVERHGVYTFRIWIEKILRSSL